MIKRFLRACLSISIWTGITLMFLAYGKNDILADMFVGGSIGFLAMLTFIAFTEEMVNGTGKTNED